MLRIMTQTSSFDCAVVIPAFNAGHYLAAALESVLIISDLTLQIIVVDDGSTDDTAEIGRKFALAHKNVKLIQQKNQGVSAARNVGLAQVRAPYTCFLDSDDCLQEGGLEELHNLLEYAEDAVAACGSVVYFDENFNRLSAPADPEAAAAVSSLTLPQILSQNFIDTPGAILFRTGALQKAGGFDLKLKMAEDWELYVRVARLGPILSSTRPMISYRLHNASAMRGHSLSMADFEPALQRVAETSFEGFSLNRRQLQTFEMRRRIGIVRLCIVGTIGIKSQLRHLIMATALLFNSRFDREVSWSAARCLVSAMKRLH